MRWVAMVPLVVFALVGLAFYAGMGRDESAGLPSALVGQAAPGLGLDPLGEIPVLDRAILDQPGVKVVNFWASWCLPCRAEHPNLVSLSQMGIPVYGVNYKDDPANAQAFLAEMGNPYAAVGADISGRTGLDWGIYGVPETFVLDDKGQVLLRFAGPVTEAVLRERILPVITKAGN